GCATLLGVPGRSGKCRPPRGTPPAPRGRTAAARLRWHGARLHEARDPSRDGRARVSSEVKPLPRRDDDGPGLGFVRAAGGPGTRGGATTRGLTPGCCAPPRVARRSAGWRVGTERRGSRTHPAVGCTTWPALKTGWATGP